VTIHATTHPLIYPGEVNALTGFAPRGGVKVKVDAGNLVLILMLRFFPISYNRARIEQRYYSGSICKLHTVGKIA
jgi:hypothetical protein